MTRRISKNNIADPAASTSIKLLEDQLDSDDNVKRAAIVRLLREAYEHQATFCNQLGESTYSAICIGRCITNLKVYETRHGEHQAFVLKHFCEPMNVDLRTVQRYCKLAKDMDDLKLRIDSGKLIVENFDERASLRGQTFSEARELIKSLLNNESNNPDPEPITDQSKVDKNDWLMPKEIVSRCIDLLSVVHVDPFAISGINTYDAITCISKPVDGTISEVEWHGNMVINPGVHRINFGEIAQRLVNEYNAGRVEQALCFFPAATNSSYGRLLRTFPRVFISKEIPVSGPALKSVIKVPMMLCFLGRKPDAFFRAFNDESFDAFMPVLRS